LEEYVRRHDEGVRKGEFAPLAALFDVNASMLFVGVPLGPFYGRDAIHQAFREQPPSGELQIISLDEGRDRTVRATFGSGTDREGSLTLTTRDGLIDQLVIDLR
jgi:hypothetical protein